MTDADVGVPVPGALDGLGATVAARHLAAGGPDALPLSADGVQADESMLTGESVPVGKRTAHLE